MHLIVSGSDTEPLWKGWVGVKHEGRKILVCTIGTGVTVPRGFATVLLPQAVIAAVLPDLKGELHARWRSKNAWPFRRKYPVHWIRGGRHSVRQEWMPHTKPLRINVPDENTYLLNFLSARAAAYDEILSDHRFYGFAGKIWRLTVNVSQITPRFVRVVAEIFSDPENEQFRTPKMLGRILMTLNRSGRVLVDGLRSAGIIGLEEYVRLTNFIHRSGGNGSFPKNRPEIGLYRELKRHTPGFRSYHLVRLVTGNPSSRGVLV